MRNGILKLSITMIFAITLVACDTEEVIDQSTIEFIDSEQAELTAKLDEGIEVLGDLTLQTFEDEENKTKGPRERFLPDCAVVTVVMEDAIKNVIVDFGTDGCENRNGHNIKGKIHMAYQPDIVAQSMMIDYSLEDFSIDEVQLAGSKTIKRLRENANGNPERTMILDLTITFRDGTQVFRTGIRTREWIEGVLNGTWGDNAFLITGEWETKFDTGIAHSTTVTTPLRREASCRFVVSGVKEIIRTRFSGSLDYGDGACDNKAIFTTAEGEEREVRL